jgi:DNA (cytosine-5)-methyltransferase 1
MKYLSLFSGIGGFEQGIEKAYEINNAHKQVGEPDYKDDISGLEGWSQSQLPTCIGFSEIDKYAVQIYQQHYPTHKNYGDITKVTAEELPDFDLIVGGFPCQSFSIAGKRGGFNDTRGTLFFEIARIIKAKRPRLLLLENVKGLLSHDEGRTFGVIISTLDELGYDLQWQVLNSKDFGVPQNRERVFIVGHLRGTPRPEVFPFGESIDNSSVPDKKDSGTSPPITTQGGKNCRGAFIQVGTLRTHKDGNGFREVKSGLAPTIPARAREDGSGQPVIKIPEATKLGYAEASVGDSINLSVPNSATRRGRVGKGVAQTLDTGMQQHTLSSDMRIRRLTPIECERLQGFPDNWTEGVSDTQRYKCLGNAVTVNVIQAIMEKLL